jgi:hypothetical protein
MKGVAGLTRRFFNNSIQTRTFLSANVAPYELSGQGATILALSVLKHE